MVRKTFNNKSCEHGPTRVFELPPVRLPLRDDFPGAVDFDNMKSCLGLIEQELEKCGISLREAGRINIAYPHKHPDRKHEDTARDVVSHFTKEIRRKARAVEWVTVDALYDKIHLDRSGNQSSAHALLKRQDYGIDPAIQHQNLPFISADYDPAQRQEYFIIVDKFIEQGTTIANMQSYITHNGGVVLGVAYFSGMASDLKQKPSICPRLKDEWKNKGRIRDLAETFYQSARVHGRGAGNLTPDECADLFESGLRAHGNSLQALTNAECDRLMYKEMTPCDRVPPWPFLQALADMGVTLPDSRPASPQKRIAAATAPEQKL